LKKHRIFRVLRLVAHTSYFLLATGITSFAQISPGELTKAHAKLEGMSNCTKCHALGDKVTNAKCLECHKEIRDRIDQHKGYHVSAEVTNKDCFSCHSEHHGRNFEIVRFDIQKFDHQTTGYKLTGAHTKQDCSACHRDQHIESVDIKSKEYTYLGLKTNCSSCHEDVHQNTLSTNCATCHTTEAFKPAPLFDHNHSDFVLKGKHKEEKCSSCHETTFVNGAMYQRFKGIEHASCASCHEDPHTGSFGNKCKDCHTEEGFDKFIGKNAFNHTQTQFPLVGKHKKVDCASCHQMNSGREVGKIFQDFKNKDFHQCITCHQDVHESKFGMDCRQCHTEESFQKVLNADKFRHELTGYPLEGMHQTIDCRQCHLNKTTDPLPHNLCGDCHQDFHKGQFVRENQKPDCRACHTVAGFSESTYTLEQHGVGVFPLTGAHQATPCFSCHLKNDQWMFRGIGTRCSDCHKDVHEGGMNEKYYPQKACDLCHHPDNWTEVQFEHQRTGFTLSGTHKKTQCVSCHQREDQDAPFAMVAFTGLQQDCASCHADQHAGQFIQDGKISCERCHDSSQWIPSTFDHNSARFKLEGAHAEVSCQKCHKEDIIAGQKTILYKSGQLACVDCHQ